ncbi:MAG: tetratricopeptide repeat protein [Acidobacteria bacterium]|nr:tetratricopeptide repeat protein [Acidobacteriota bacterium]
MSVRPGKVATGYLRPYLLLLLACLAANLGSLAPGFIFDDHKIVEQNDLIRDLSRLPDIFARGYWSSGERSVPNLYRPLTILSLAANRALFGDRAFGFRLVNLLLHVLVTFLVFALGRRLQAASAWTSRVADPALLAALLFAVHPAHTEVLGMVVGRAELLAAAGSLGCVLAFLLGREREARPGAGGPWALYALAVACFIFGFLAKENAVVAPLLAVMADRALERRAFPRRFALAAGTALLAVFGLRFAAIGSLRSLEFVSDVDNPIAHAAFLPARLTALKVIAGYARLLVFPRRFSVDYSFDAIPVVRGPDPGALLGGALVLGCALAAWIGWRRGGTVAFALAWIGVALAPVANLFFPIGTIMAERLLYLPSVGLCLAAALLFDRAWGRIPGVGVARGAAAVLLLALAGQSVARLREWRDDYTIFKAAVAAAPRSARALFSYGAACEKRGEDEEAIGAYVRAVEVFPAFSDAHYNLGGVYARRRSWDRAVGHYREAVRQQPGNVQFLVNLASALNGQGRPSEAVRLLQSALDLDPRSDRAYSVLGASRLAMGDAGAAAQAYGEALRIDPANPDYYRNLGLAQAQAGDPRAAAGSFRQGLALRPDDPDLAIGLATALLDSADAAGALEALRRVVAAHPDHPVSRFHLARALERAGDLTESAAQYREAIRLAPGVPIPERALGLLLYRMGDREGARAALERAGNLDPEGKVMDAESRRLLETLRRGSRR